ncbi:50s ribosomal protein L10 [Mycoplasmopsis californica]|uniref:Large ribosomal subunit protein uL10 n=1 Tax=Mycoplasmopsis equigenitalium TaxID=114883 RepID=A0ABY5J1M9_9BACT|nr:50S ribosomal protein L10 [Mycoplasmopsis equigenitalium]UUD36678.1 50S ribosomal protein L10 [Mycoplasmopsis equigenitalium]VEU69359.1 50s ribosomal protein L10 [Mycoplasmopsis californica]
MADSKFRLIKKDTVKEISNKLANSKALVVAQYSGLKVSELQTLRREAKHHGVDIKVYKNRLFKLAAADAKLNDLDQYLVGSSIFAFSNNDDMSAAKVLSAFAKTNKLLVIKAGTYEGKVIDADGVKMVASLPTYEEALGILGRSLLAPLQQISIGLKMLVDENKLAN